MAQYFPEQFPRRRHLGQLERDVPAWLTTVAPIFNNFSRNVANTFAAKTAADPVTSGLLDRTRQDQTGEVCAARRGTLSQREKVTGRAFDRQIGLIKGRNPTYRAGSRREVWCERPSCYHRRQPGGAIWGIPAKMFEDSAEARCENTP